MQMALDRSACLAAVALAASFMTASTVDARTIHHRAAEYAFPRAAYDRIGDGPFQYRGNFSYGADRVPYAYDGAHPRDFQLEGR
jgi:hypothetical protein